MTGIIAVEMVGSTPAGIIYVLMDTGETYKYDCPEGTEWLPTTALPVPLTDLKFWEHHYCVTNNDEVWFCDAGNWINLGVPPSGPTNMEPSTWGSIKAKWHEDE